MIIKTLEFIKTRLEQKNAELKAENERLKQNLHELKCPFFFKHTAICLGRKDEMQKHEKCSYHANCNVKQMIKENERLKEEIKRLDEDNFCYEVSEIEYQRMQKYKQTLQEIKAIADEWLNNDWSCFHCRINMDEKLKDILDLITKAESEG